MTINFAGEGRQELDFLASKHEIWTATVALSKEIIKAAEKHSDKKFILEHKWWTQVRYQKVGKLIANRLSVNSNLKNSLRNMFSEHNDQLSYHDLFGFFETSQK
jgi:hypothetical protein